MKQFTAKFGDRIQGVLSGFDRVVFRGRLRPISYPAGIAGYLVRRGVRLTEFGKHAEEVSKRLKTACLAAAMEAGRYCYLNSTRINKEQMALCFAQEHQITSGLVCSLAVVEPCRTFRFRGGEKGTPMIEACERKCTYVYHYWIDAELGWSSARIQTWFPFNTQVCVNGREWLARQMDRAGIGYVRHDNCFPWIEDFARAQELMNAQRQANWAELLEPIGTKLNPLLGELFGEHAVRYYWSVYQGEWATDVSFRRASELRRLAPRFMSHAMTKLSSEDVLRFLGRPRPGHFRGDASSDLRRREEGVRIKHRINENSIKLYDKAYETEGAVLRAETTINNATDFKVYRPKEGDSNGKRDWRPMRKGVADLYRRAEVSQRANERYLDALAAADDDTQLKQWTAKLERPAKWNDKRVRALHPFEKADSALLEAVAHGEFTISGFRNRDLQRLLFAGSARSPEERRRRTAAISRKLRLLRAHGLVRKVQHTHRYQLTNGGRRAITAVLAAQQASVNSLTAKAA